MGTGWSTAYPQVNGKRVYVCDAGQYLLLRLAAVWCVDFLVGSYAPVTFQSHRNFWEAVIKLFLHLSAIRAASVYLYPGVYPCNLLISETVSMPALPWPKPFLVLLLGLPEESVALWEVLLEETTSFQPQPRLGKEDQAELVEEVSEELMRPGALDPSVVDEPGQAQVAADTASPTIMRIAAGEHCISGETILGSGRRECDATGGTILARISNPAFFFNQRMIEAVACSLACCCHFDSCMMASRSLLNHCMMVWPLLACGEGHAGRYLLLSMAP